MTVGLPTHPRFIDMSGKTCARLTVLAYAGSKVGGGAMWVCRCECGTELDVRGVELRNGNVKSCGCLHIEQAENHQKNVLSPMAVKHGKHKNDIYRIWANMKDRCYNENCKDYKFYGGLGVRMAPEWIDDFEEFERSIGRRPSSKHTIDRYPNKEGNYEPGNVRWATWTEQANNKRNTRWLEYQGKKITWANAYREFCPNVSYQTFCSRLVAGWPVERAING